MSVNLKFFYHLHTRIVLVKLMNSTMIIFLFNKKSDVDALLQKILVLECSTEMVISENVLQQGEIMRQRSTPKTPLTTNNLCKDVAE